MIRRRLTTRDVSGPALRAGPGRRARTASTVLLACTILLGHAPPAPRHAPFRIAAADLDVSRLSRVDDGSLGWRSVRAGLEITELEITQAASLPTRVVVARVDPTRLRFTLRSATRAGGTLGDWTIDDIADDVVLALNAGQFEGGLPWGWLVRDGLELHPPGSGPLSAAIVFDRLGRVSLVPWREIPIHRFRGDVVLAFQSYPALLDDGRVPDQLLEPGRGVDLTHRDIRLAFGTRDDGRLLIAITRFADAAGISLPWGPTVPEIAALMAALGARDAVLLDGGLSAQLAITDSTGLPRHWPAARRVPLALEATPVP